jgi:hypothetical protein
MASLIRQRFAAVLDHDPVLVVPNVDDVFAFERRLCEEGAALGGSALTFGALFRTVATAAGAPPGAELSPAQRLRAISIAVASGLPQLGPLRRSAGRPGFPRAFERLLDELQGAGIEPAAVEASAATLEGSAYLSDIATLFAGYAEARDRTGRVDSHGIAREAIALLRDEGSFWGERPVFLYGLDDLTPNQFELVKALAALTEVTVALPFEEGSAALAARAGLLGELRERIGSAEETATATDPASTESALLFHLARRFGSAGAEPMPADDGLVLLRSAGARGEAEAIAGEASRLIHGGADPAEIAIAVRDPGRRGPAIAAALEANGIATALEAELPVAGTAVGGALVALLEAEFGSGRASDLLRYLRGPSSFSPGRVDWLERSLRRGRVEDAATALTLWQGEEGEPPRDLVRLREAAGRSAATLAAEVGRLAATTTDRRSAPATGWSCARPGPSPARSKSWPSSVTWRRGRRSWRGRSPGSSSGSGAGRSRAGCESPAPTGCAPAVSTTSSSPRCRTASSRAATAAATPSSPKPSGARSGSTRGATARPRSATCSASASRCRAGAFSSPTATAMRTVAPSRARRCSTTCGRCWLRRPTAPPPTRSRRRSPEAVTWRASSTRSPRRPRRTSWRGRWPLTGPTPTRRPCLPWSVSTRSGASGSPAGSPPPAPPRRPRGRPGR